MDFIESIVLLVGLAVLLSLVNWYLFCRVYRNWKFDNLTAGKPDVNPTRALARAISTSRVWFWLVEVLVLGVLTAVGLVINRG
jgi:hypothetical protein